MSCKTKVFDGKVGCECADRNAHQPPQQRDTIELLNGPNAPSFLAGTDNFYAITRYNWISYFALAVIELGQAVKAALRP